MPYILSKADVNALNYSTNFGKYGGSMNKMFLGLASGKPLCCNVGMPYSIILEEGVGIDCKLTDPQVMPLLYFRLKTCLLMSIRQYVIKRKKQPKNMIMRNYA